ncbi:hypothetical protein [Nocardioides gilvus]|uniref:hypothetical protein n=1 Tax=Nocardioides gilvus TaxID=1735589 RepID=UPI000D74DE81|nr:hypothetical protein [Nocardioides gilvus]
MTEPTEPTGVDEGVHVDPSAPGEADTETATSGAASPEELSDWERKRRLAEIFGDVLPTTTRDERGQGRGGSQESANDAWLRRQVPPHHGG